VPIKQTNKQTNVALHFTGPQIGKVLETQIAISPAEWLGGVPGVTHCTDPAVPVKFFL
jgi:hypothetical protein